MSESAIDTTGWPQTLVEFMTNGAISPETAAHLARLWLERDKKPEGMPLHAWLRMPEAPLDVRSYSLPMDAP